MHSSRRRLNASRCGRRPLVCLERQGRLDGAVRRVNTPATSGPGPAFTRIVSFERIVGINLEGEGFCEKVSRGDRDFPPPSLVPRWIRSSVTTTSGVGRSPASLNS